ncbi:MAG TPA: hypothetical protein VEV83_13515 [Parafilimonas sp.]|nr:hypothetical protein [Parafilimonas sp.]
MGLFSFTHKREPERVVETSLGPFTLAYSKDNRNIWTNRTGRLAMSVRGTEFQPERAQLEFLENIDKKILDLNDEISSKFIQAFKEADMEIDFTTWQERFKLEEVQVLHVHGDDTHWNITFEDMKEPYAQFTLTIEGEKVTDFYIDT